MIEYIFLCLIFLSKVYLKGTEGYEKGRALPTSCNRPTENTGSPDLTVPMEYYDCLSIKESRNCKGMSDFFVPETGVFSETSSNFDIYVNKEVNNDCGILMALCPNSNIKHNLQKVAYRYSVFCGRYLFAQARWCPQNSDFVRANPQFSLCKSTCIEYAKSVADYGQTICGNTDNAIGEKIKENIINKWCNIFTDEEGCLKGTEKEIENCGYASASYALDAQTFNPHNRCWNNDIDSGIVDQLKNRANIEKTETKKMGSIKTQIAYPLGSISVVTLLTLIFWIRQNKLYKRGYVEKPTTKSNDYDVIPSSAEPSREYVNDEFIKSFELEVPKASFARSGSLSLNRTLTKRQNKKYMIALYNYHPQKNDELELRSGDRIAVEYEYDDGWAAGINEVTKKFGAFPLICCTSNISNNEDSLPKRSKSRITANSSIKKRPTQNTYHQYIPKETTQLHTNIF